MSDRILQISVICVVVVIIFILIWLPILIWNRSVNWKTMSSSEKTISWSVPLVTLVVLGSFATWRHYELKKDGILISDTVLPETTNEPVNKFINSL